MKIQELRLIIEAFQPLYGYAVGLLALIFFFILVSRIIRSISASCYIANLRDRMDSTRSGLTVTQRELQEISEVFQRGLNTEKP